MKRYIAFHNAHNSGVVSHEAALKWATDLMGKSQASKVHICEVIEVVERKAPPIEIKKFECYPE